MGGEYWRNMIGGGRVLEEHEWGGRVLEEHE